MKKLLSLTLVMMLMLSCVVLPVSAEKSPELKDIITSVEVAQQDNAQVSVKLEEMTQQDSDLVPKFSKDTVITQRKVTITGDAQYPLAITATIDGVKANSFMYILAKAADGSVVRLSVNAEKDGVASFTFDKPYTAVSFINAAKEAVADTSTPVEVNKEELDHAVEMANEQETVTVYLEKSAAVKLPLDTVEQIISRGLTLTVKSDLVSAEFDKTSLSTIVDAAKAKEDVSYIIVELVKTEDHHTTDAEKATVEKLKPALLLTARVIVDGEYVQDFKGGKVKVTIPFKAETGYTLTDYLLIHIKDNGAIERIATKPGVDQLIAELEHFSEYAIVRTADLDAVEDTLGPVAEDDNTLTIIIIALAAVVLLALILILILLKKKKKDDEEEA